MSQGKVLMVVDDVLRSHEELPDEIEATFQQADRVYVVAPALNTRLASLCGDDEKARHDADERLHAVIDFLRSGEHVAAEGEVGDESPLQAIEDALAEFEADRIVLAVHAGRAENWREHHLVERVQQRIDLPTTVIRVDHAAA